MFINTKQAIGQVQGFLEENLSPTTQKLVSIPAEWMDRDETGRLNGPTPDATKDEIYMYRTLLSLCETVGL
jgi:hypothetical protein